MHDDLRTVADADGRVRHRFGAEGPNRLWLTDITEHPTGEGKMYCCAGKDVFAGRIVGYAIGSHMRDELAVLALDNAVPIRGGIGEVTGYVVYSDRGSQFRSGKFLAALQHHRMVGCDVQGGPVR